MLLKRISEMDEAEREGEREEGERKGERGGGGRGGEKPRVGDISYLTVPVELQNSCGFRPRTKESTVIAGRL